MFTQIRVITCLVMLSLLRQNHHRPDFFGILSLTQDSTVACKQSGWVSTRDLAIVITDSSLPFSCRTEPYYRMRDALHTSQTIKCSPQLRRKGHALLGNDKAPGQFCVRPSGPQGSAKTDSFHLLFLESVAFMIQSLTKE